MGGFFIKHWHVLQVYRGQEDQYIEKIQNDEFVAFVPRKVKWIKRKEVVQRVEELLFNGYVFIETDKSYLEFLDHFHSNLKPVKSFIRLLGSKGFGEESIHPHEKAFIENFTNHRKIVEPSIGVIVGDKVMITDGPLVGKESMIKHINRHKRQATLVFDFFGQSQELNVSLEIIKKVKSLDDL